MLPTVRWLLCGAALLLLDYPALADPIIVPPSGHNSQQVAANVPSADNIWNGVAQSFTAENPNVLFAFSMANQSAGSVSAVFSFYAGDGAFVSLLGERTVSVSPGYTPSFVEADFSSIDLVVGSHYTVVASLPGMSYPAVGSYSDISIWYAATSPGPTSYAGGRFYFTGSSYDATLPAFADRDIGFSVVPVSVPEPPVIPLFLAGFAFVAATAFRRSTRIAKARKL